MSKPKTLSDLLHAQPEEDLIEMRDGLRAELERLTFELEIVESTLARRSRRRTGSDTVGRGTVRRDDVFAIVQELGGTVTTTAVRSALAQRGTPLSGAAARNHLRRLVRDKRIIAVADGKYQVAFRPMPEIAAGDPLFRDAEPQSQTPQAPARV